MNYIESIRNVSLTQPQLIEQLHHLFSVIQAQHTNEYNFAMLFMGLSQAVMERLTSETNPNQIYILNETLIGLSKSFKNRQEKLNENIKNFLVNTMKSTQVFQSHLSNHWMNISQIGQMKKKQQMLIEKLDSVIQELQVCEQKRTSLEMLDIVNSDKISQLANHNKHLQYTIQKQRNVSTSELSQLSSFIQSLQKEKTYLINEIQYMKNELKQTNETFQHRKLLSDQQVSNIKKQLTIQKKKYQDELQSIKNKFNEQNQANIQLFTKKQQKLQSMMSKQEEQNLATNKKILEIKKQSDYQSNQIKLKLEKLDNKQKGLEDANLRLDKKILSLQKQNQIWSNEQIQIRKQMNSNIMNQIQESRKKNEQQIQKIHTKQRYLEDNNSKMDKKISDLKKQNQTQLHQQMLMRKQMSSNIMNQIQESRKKSEQQMAKKIQKYQVQIQTQIKDLKDNNVRDLTKQKQEIYILNKKYIDVQKKVQYEAKKHQKQRNSFFQYKKAQQAQYIGLTKIINNTDAQQTQQIKKNQDENQVRMSKIQSELSDQKINRFNDELKMKKQIEKQSENRIMSLKGIHENIQNIKRSQQQQFKQNLIEREKMKDNIFEQLAENKKQRQKQHQYNVRQSHQIEVLNKKQDNVLTQIAKTNKNLELFNSKEKEEKLKMMKDFTSKINQIQTKIDEQNRSMQQTIGKINKYIDSVSTRIKQFVKQISSVEKKIQKIQEDIVFRTHQLKQQIMSTKRDLLQAKKQMKNKQQQSVKQYEKTQQLIKHVKKEGKNDTQRLRSDMNNKFKIVGKQISKLNEKVEDLAQKSNSSYRFKKKLLMIESQKISNVRQEISDLAEKLADNHTKLDNIKQKIKSVANQSKVEPYIPNEAFQAMSVDQIDQTLHQKIHDVAMDMLQEAVQKESIIKDAYQTVTDSIITLQQVNHAEATIAMQEGVPQIIDVVKNGGDVINKVTQVAEQIEKDQLILEEPMHILTQTLNVADIHMGEQKKSIEQDQLNNMLVQNKQSQQPESFKRQRKWHSFQHPNKRFKKEQKNEPSRYKDIINMYYDAFGQD